MRTYIHTFLRFLLTVKPLVWVLSAAILIRIVFFIVVAQSQPQGLGNEVNDGMHYLKLAQSILNHQSYAIQYPNGEIKDFFRPPAYPLFIAFTLFLDKSLQFLIYLQILLSAGTVFFIAQTAKYIFKSKNYLLPAVLYAVEPNNIAYCTYISSETLFVFLWIFALFLFFKAWQEKKAVFLYISASLFVFSLYTRPIAQYGLYLTSFFMLYAMFKRIFTLKQGVIYISIILILPCVWSFRNYVHTKHFVFTAQKGWQTLFFYCASVEQHITGQGFEETQIQFFNRYPTEYIKKHHIAVTDTTNLLVLTNAITFEDDRYFQQEAKKYFLSHKLDFVHSFIKGTTYMLFGVGNWTWETYLGNLQKRGLKQVFDEPSLIQKLKSQFVRDTVQQTLFRILHCIFLLMVYTLFLRNVYVFRRNVYMYFLILLMLYMMILVAIVMENRYRIPIIAMMSMLGFYDKSLKSKR